MTGWVVIHHIFVIIKISVIMINMTVIMTVIVMNQDIFKKMIFHKKFCPCGKVFHQEIDDKADFDEIWSGKKRRWTVQEINGDIEIRNFSIQ